MYEAYYENDDGYGWTEYISVKDGEDPFEVAYKECPYGYSLFNIQKLNSNS